MVASFDYVQDYILREWTENLWLALGAADNTTATRGDQLDTLRRQMITALEQSEPKGGKAMSERGLTLLCLGMAYGASVAPKTIDKVSDSKLVDAWRASVHRNRYQSRYDIFESVLKTAVDRLGVKGALAQYPHSHVSAADVSEALTRIGFKATHFKEGEVAHLIRGVEVTPTPSAGNKPGPKA